MVASSLVFLCTPGVAGELCRTELGTHTHTLGSVGIWQRKGLRHKEGTVGQNFMKFGSAALPFRTERRGGGACMCLLTVAFSIKAGLMLSLLLLSVGLTAPSCSLLADSQ
jgi:hypothetical protein